jgi:hypothetical protein
MPYHVESDNESCNGYAVVKDSDGEVMGCHRTQGQAEEQIAAINASQDEERAAGDPPAIVTDIDARNPISNRSLAEQILADIRARR